VSLYHDLRHVQPFAREIYRGFGFLPTRWPACRADKEKAEIEIIEAYLPQSASREEIELAVATAIVETGAASLKDMGKVMKAAQVTLEGKNADGRVVSEIVKAKLGR